MGRTKKHHYLPQFYLRGFSAVAEGRPKHIWRILKAGTGEHHMVNIADAGQRSDYHTVADRAGNGDSTSVEKALSQFEAAQSEVLSRVTAGLGRPPEDSKIFAEFVALMICRVPSYKAYVELAIQAAASRTLEEILQGDGFEDSLARLHSPEIARATAERARRIWATGRLNFSLPEAALLGHMFGTAENPEFIARIQEMGTTFYEAPAGSCFLTADRPVAWYCPSPIAPDQFGAGLANPRIELTIPVSARLLARLDHCPTGWQFESATVAQVGEFNRRTIISADKELFAPQKTPELLTVIRANCCHRAGIEAVVMRGTPWPLYRVVPILPVEYYDMGLGAEGRIVD